MILCFKCVCKFVYKINKIVNKFLLAGDKFVPVMHLKQPGFTYNACGPFTKKTERNQKLKETGDTSYIYWNVLDKTCFQHDMAYGDFKDLVWRTAPYKILRDKAFISAKKPKCLYLKEDLLLWFTNCLKKSRKGVVLLIIILNKIYN